MENITAEDFLKKTGMDEPMAPGMIKYKHVAGDKEGGSYTVVYDWRSDLEKIRVEVRAGMSGQQPSKQEMKKYAVWLQTQNYLELDLSESKGNA